MCVECESDGGIDMERSDGTISRQSSFAEGCGWLAWRVLIWACWLRIMLSRRF